MLYAVLNSAASKAVDFILQVYSNFISHDYIILVCLNVATFLLFPSLFCVVICFMLLFSDEGLLWKHPLFYVAIILWIWPTLHGCQLYTLCFMHSTYKYMVLLFYTDFKVSPCAFICDFSYFGGFCKVNSLNHSTLFLRWDRRIKK